MDTIPNELLIAILKLAADAPLPSSSLAPAIPICATRVSRRWRAVALLSSELWTTIRISDRPGTIQQAELFVTQSGSRPLDISITLPDSEANTVDAVGEIMGILGRNVSRWRTVAFRGSPLELEKFRSFIASERDFPSLESLYVSCTETEVFQDPHYIHGIAELTHLRSLKSNGISIFGFVPQAPMLQALDINLDYAQSVALHMLRDLLESPACRLTTLVLRKFHAKPVPVWPPPAPIVAHSLRSFAVSFGALFYTNIDLWRRYGGFEAVTNLFCMPNLERLEILGGFRGGSREALFIEHSGEWPREWYGPPLFPRLRSLRLEGIHFSPTNIDMIQSFSPDITHLELIYTSGNEHLLHPDLQWPAVREVLVEAYEGPDTPWWLQRFLQIRSKDVPFAEMVLSVVPPRHQLALNRSCVPGTVRYLADGPSDTLFDSIAPSTHGFYVFPSQTRVADFEYLRDAWFWEEEEPELESDADSDGERLDAEISEVFKRKGDVRRERRRRARVRRDEEREGRMSDKGRRSKRRVYDFEDHSLV